MKTNSLHNTLNALDITVVHTPQYQQALKRALMNHEVPKQTLARRLRAAAKNIIGVPMTYKKLFASFGSLTLILVLALALTTVQHSPRALAEQLVNQGIGHIKTFDNGQMGKIQAQLGDDPVKALEEAKTAKDLQVITKDEYNAEAKKHKGVAMSSLGTSGPQFSSVGISANGESLPTTPPTGAKTQQYSTGGSVSGSTESGTSQPKKVIEFHDGDSSAPVAGQPGSPIPAPPTPSKYLRYTNTTGHVVVLGLDESGTPVTKTIFMTDADVQNMPKPNLGTQN